MPLSIDGMNTTLYGSRPLNLNSPLQANQVERSATAAQRLTQEQERIADRQRLEQERQDQLQQARERRLEQQQLQQERVEQQRLQRQQDAQAINEQLREQRLQTLELQQQAQAELNDPLSAESLARQRAQQPDAAPPALGIQSQVSPRLANEAINTYRQVESPDLSRPSLVA